MRGIAAMIGGYALIVLLTTLGFNVLLEGRQIYGSRPPIVAAGAMVAVVAGLAGGYAAGWIGAARGVVNAALVLIPLAADTIYVLFFFDSPAPFWFDLMSSLTLLACTMAGGYLRDFSAARYRSA